MDKKVKVLRVGGRTTYLNFPKELFATFPREQHDGFWIRTFAAGPWSSHELYRGSTLATEQQAQSLFGPPEVQALEETDAPEEWDPVPETETPEPEPEKEKETMGHIRILISEDALADGSVVVENVEIGPSGTFELPLPFSSTRAPVNAVGRPAGSQAPGFDPIYSITYTGFATGWFLNRKNSGTPYFRNASSTEYMDCPYKDPVPGSGNSYVIVDLPS